MNLTNLVESIMVLMIGCLIGIGIMNYDNIVYMFTVLLEPFNYLLTTLK